MFGIRDEMTRNFFSPSGSSSEVLSAARVLVVTVSVPSQQKYMDAVF